MAPNFLISSHHRAFRRNNFFPHRKFLPHKTLPQMLMLLWSVFFSLVGGYYVLQKLRVFAAAPQPPSHVVARSEDHSALIQWNPSPDPDTVGYKVTWSEIGGAEKTRFTADPDTQLQPLDIGKTYKIIVQSVNKNGDVSIAVGPAYAESNATYVKSIRAQMNGMFDDFNDNSYNGLPDPTHWFTSVTNASANSMAYVSGVQKNLQMFVQNNQDAQAQEPATVTMRSLVPFDFTNRTGTVAFDFDWGQKPIISGVGVGRYQWSLTISPVIADNVSANGLFNGSSVVFPMEGFQVHMESNAISFRKITNGVVTGEWDSTYAHVHPIRDVGVLKHSILKLSNSSATLFIDGVQILSANDINLGFSKGWVYNQQIVSDLFHAHVPFALSQFDNFGFDAPIDTPPPVVHTYTAGGYGVTDRKVIDFFNTSATYTITVPDAYASSEAERLLVDANINGQITPTVRVNGVSVSWPQILGFDDNNSYHTRVINLPVGTLHTGANTIEISATDKNTFHVGVQNVHVEIEFPRVGTLSYTPYAVPFSGNAIEEKIPSVAPIPLFGEKSPADGDVLHGTINIEAAADGAFALLPTGHVNPVTQIELDVDGAPQSIVTLSHPAVKTDQLLQLDTTKIPNGQHTLTITAYGLDKSNNGIIASLNSLDPLLQNNPLDNAKSLRRVIIINNGPLQPTVMPTSIPQAIDTPIPTHIPSPTAIPQASQSGILGNTLVGRTQDVNEENHLNGSRFVTGKNGGKTTSMSVYIGDVDTTPNNSYQMALYSDLNGSPGVLLATTPVGQLTPHAWNSLPLTATLTSNTSYWLLYNTSSNYGTKNNMVYDTSDARDGISIVQPFGTWPSVFSVPTRGAWKFSLFITYLPETLP